MLAREFELAVAAHPVDGESGGERLDAPVLPHRKRLDARGDQQASAWIDREGAQLNSAPIDVLDQSRLAGRLVDREHRDAVFAAREYWLAFDIDGRRGTIGEIDEAAIGVHVDRAGSLPRR